MNQPQPYDYIDVHTHGAAAVSGVFSVDVLMAHEERLPSPEEGIAFTAGIHPWFLNNENHKRLLSFVSDRAAERSIIAIGEAGFDKLKGPQIELQKMAFEEQAALARDHGLPLVIHCVKAWEELLKEFRRLKPVTPWLIHGFRGSNVLASQLVSRGMYLSLWFSFATRPEAALLLRCIPSDRIFLETDGSEEDIANIYKAVSQELGLEEDELKERIRMNYFQFFGLSG